MNVKKYKIGLIGATMQDDYGLIMSHLGLCEFLKTNGVNFSIILPPYTKNYCKTSTSLFSSLYTITKKISLSNYNKYNKEFDTFLLGPGEVWDWNFYNNRQSDVCSYLNFVGDTKKIITYGPTFKLDYPTVLISRLDKHLEYKEQLNRFNNITVASQEDSDILNDFYNIKEVKPVIDAMFLPKRQFFLDFIKNKKYLSDNVLTIYPINKISRRETAIETANRLECNLVKIATGNHYDCQQLFERSIVLDNIEISNPPENPMKFEDWLETIFNSKYILCCDYYSICVSVMMMKNFVIFEDHDDTRVEFIINKLGLQNRVIQNHDIDKAVELFNTTIDWKPIYDNLRNFKKKSIINLNKMLNI